MENWKIIKNHENYSVSDTREIKNLTTGELKTKSEHTKGYDQVSIDGHTFLVHKLVCEAFNPNPENKPCVDHIDGNKKNNSASNLRWVSYRENNNNPNTKWKNSREPWNKGLTGLTWNWSEEAKQKMLIGSIKAGEAMRRKAAERRKSPEWERKVEAMKERLRILSREDYQRNKTRIRAKAMGVSEEEYVKWRAGVDERSRLKKEAHERAQARKQYKKDNPNWKKEEKRKYEEDNKEVLREKRKKYRLEHLEEIRAKDRERKRKKKQEAA